ncbi:MAG: cell wall-active antibiotics response protein [Acidobacteria bacterium]|jgi:predicted membrane protein|nr:cell wall-active antibiotics response protein [Acidobacteriota bacterium]
MNDRHASIFSTRLFIGLLIVAAGVILLLERMKVIEDIHILEYWPIILILIGLGKLLRRDGGGYHGFFWGIIITAVGVLFLLNNLHYIQFGFKELWPIFIIIIGLEIISGVLFRRRVMKKWHEMDDKDKEKMKSGCCAGFYTMDDGDSDFIHISAILGGGKYMFANQKLKGGNISTLMGGCEIDLRNAEMEGDSMIIETSCIMGGIEMKVPKHWEVVMQGTPVMGSMENKTISPGNAVKKLFIRGSAVMGGVEIKN